ncbi:MAG: polysaccharide deacetylase family protein [Clostridia bacterium]|nr:polysaccharide deacetylase family protein [Clostridia bacterium]
MAIFKSKKTYIKRYASKNADKKVTFAPAVKATFNGAALRDKTAAPKANTSTGLSQTDTLTGGGTKTGNIRYGQPDEKYLKLFTDKKPEYTKNEVISGPGAIKPAPIEKPDLSNVKPDAHVRPIVDGKVVGAPVTDKIDEEFPKAKEPKDVSQAFEPVADKQPPLPEFSANDILTEVPETPKPLKDVPDSGKPLSAVASADKVQTVKTDNKPPKAPKSKREATVKLPVGKLASVGARVAVLLVLVGAVGVAGYKYIGQYSLKLSALNSALNTQYPAEDYIYPETPEDVAAVNAAARQEAEAQARANAYVPSRSEVPNLFSYDYVKTCYLTFDDGPSGDVTESILDTLKQYNIPATFFVVGKNAEAHPELLKRMEAEGHSIGNHSYSHDYDYMYSGDPGFDDELYSCRNAINRILGKEYNNMLYRFPGGSFEVYKQFYIYNIEALGYQHVDWNALTGDSEIENPDENYIMETLKETTNNGTKEDIVLLMHDAGAKQITADTLPKVIEYLKSKNYVFKAVKNSNYAE